MDFLLKLRNANTPEDIRRLKLAFQSKKDTADKVHGPLKSVIFKALKTLGSTPVSATSAREIVDALRQVFQLFQLCDDNNKLVELEHLW